MFISFFKILKNELEYTQKTKTKYVNNFMAAHLFVTEASGLRNCRNTASFYLITLFMDVIDIHSVTNRIKWIDERFTNLINRVWSRETELTRTDRVDVFSQNIKVFLHLVYRAHTCVHKATSKKIRPIY